MSWVDGGFIMSTIIAQAQATVSCTVERARLYCGLIKLFEGRGCDVLPSLCFTDHAFDVAMGCVHPELWNAPEDDTDYPGPAMFPGEPPQLELLGTGDVPMGREEFESLEVGDFVRHVGSSQAMIIHARNQDARGVRSFTGVRTSDIANPEEWVLVRRRRD